MSVRKSITIQKVGDDDFIFRGSAASFSDIDDLSDIGDELKRMETSAEELVQRVESSIKPKKSVPLFTVLAVLVPVVTALILWQIKPASVMKPSADGKTQVLCWGRLALHVLLVSVVAWGIMWIICKVGKGKTGCSVCP